MFCVRFTPVVPQWYVNDPSYSVKSAGGRLHLNTRTPLTQRSRIGLTMSLSRQSVGTYQGTSLYATRQGTLGHGRLSSLSHFMWTDPGTKEWNYCARANLHFKKKKLKRRRGMNDRTLPKSSQARKRPPPPPPLQPPPPPPLPHCTVGGPYRLWWTASAGYPLTHSLVVCEPVWPSGKALGW